MWADEIYHCKASVHSDITCAPATWSQLPICPTTYFGLTQLDRKVVVAVGGKHHDQTDISINDVYIFQDSETQENSIIPPLLTACLYPTAVNDSGSITDWHTDNKFSTYTTAVEVFQTKTFQWHHTEPLPVGHSVMSCVIVSDTCYLIGGTKSGTASRQASISICKELDCATVVTATHTPSVMCRTKWPSTCTR